MEQGTSRPPLSHALVPAGDPVLLTTPEAIADFAAHARSQPVLAFDTEFIGEESFRPRICLVQMATAERVVLVDPLQGLDMGPVWGLVADPAVLTVVHAGEQDVEAVRTALGRQPASLVDTQVAASLVGLPWPTSLGTLVEHITGHRPAKAHTFTNWDARPLTAAQLRYAADDVRYLPLVWSRLQEQLASSGRLQWALRESEEALQGDAVFDPARQVKRAARGEPLRPAALTLLRELVVLRHDLAREADQPPRALLSDATLVEVAKRRPTTPSLLGAVRGLPKPTLHAHGERILATVERAKALPPTREEHAKLLEDATVRAEIDALWLAAQARCLAMGLAPTLVMSRAAFTDWYAGRIAARRRAARRPDAEPAAPPSPLFDAGSWREEAVGAWLEAFVAGREGLELRWRAGLVTGNGHGPPLYSAP